MDIPNTDTVVLLLSALLSCLWVFKIVRLLLPDKILYSASKSYINVWLAKN